MEREYKTGVLTNLGEIWKINRKHQSRGRKDEGENFFREKNLQQRALRRGTWSFLENQNLTRWGRKGRGRKERMIEGQLSKDEIMQGLGIFMQEL